MPQNLKLKARITSISHALQCVREIGARAQGTLKQTDQYYGVKQGRLKLRIDPSRQAELIYSLSGSIPRRLRHHSRESGNPEP